MKLTALFIIITFNILYNPTSLAGKSNRQLKKPSRPCELTLPRVTEGCQRKLCECRVGYSLITDANMYGQSSTSSKIIKKLKAQTRFRNRKLRTITTKYGLAYYVSGARHVNTVYESRDGSVEICEGKKTFSVLNDNPYRPALGISYEQETLDWAQVTLADNSKGWVLTKHLTFGLEDKCNFDPPLK